MVNYNEEDGLNSSYTYHLRQDKNGFIWIGSDNGLFRFDGKEFKQYGKKEGLKNIDIISCEPLPNGEVFILPFLNNFAYLKNGRVINLNINDYLKNQFSSSIPKITAHLNKLYLYSTQNPQNIFIYENGKVKKTPVLLDYKKRGLSTIQFDFRSNYLYLNDPEKDHILIYNLISRKEKEIKIDKGNIICEKDDLFVFQNQGKIDVYQRTDPLHLKKIHSYDTKEDIFYGLIDKNNKLWLNVQNGGVLYFNQSLLKDNKNLAPPLKILSNQVINNVLVDKDDNVWFNSRNSGVFFITKALFTNHINLSLKNNSEYITAIGKDDNNIILGYNNSYGSIIGKNGKMQDITLDKDSKIENKSIYINNNISIFGLSNKIVIHDISTNRNTKMLYALKNIVPYTRDSVFFCTAGNLMVYNLKNKKTTELLNERTYTVLPYTKEDLFIGSFSDVYKFNITTKKKTLFLQGYYFTDIKKLRNNVYLGATHLHGIIVFNEKGILKKIEKSNGLINEQIKKIDVENTDTFWASTNSGISRITLAENKVLINNFTQTDGLPSNAVAGCVIRNDTIFIGTSKGLGVFSIKKLLAQEKFIHKKVIINSVTIKNNEHFNLNDDLTGYTDNTITFNLSFLDYASQGKISYKYKIEGLNDSWQVNNSSKIIFSSIPPGKYIFRVYGLGYNGKQSYTSTDLAFEIKPKFWQTWWFKLLLAAIAIVILSTIINSYLQKKRNKKLEKFYHEKKIAELELQAIKAQINPHFIYNCLNSIKFLLFKEDYQETENYLDLFSQLIRKTLHYSEKTFMPISEEIEYLSLYMDMEKLRQNELFDYEIHVSEKVQKNWVIPSLLIQPFVENAIKHGISSLKTEKGYIKISFDHTDSVLCVTIEDNGTGIKTNKESFTHMNSFGLKLSQKRIETFQQLFETHITLEIINLSEQSEKQGTQVKLYITPYENQNTSLHH
ncbi:two component regulator with propeller domain [Chryseobacterium sp. 52]|uniref:sensor histidine kinase n=1 Tax=Chryseobacterium sp. 52 TaxID=2035213 RepID=UPI000C3812F7|nr:histidine kinase [Chryseobacterium sp. 52]PIF46199.1 two component regulator with propeller domain [Chryseobacterium sp. 52]